MDELAANATEGDLPVADDLLVPVLDRNRLGIARSFHRKKHDEERHREQTPPPTPLDHVLVPKGMPDTVTSPEGLAEVLGQLKAAGRFAFDTEFIGETHFYPRLCLVQVATRDHIWLLDPLACPNDPVPGQSLATESNGLDLTPFWELVADPSVEKILHAATQDVEPVMRLLGKTPANIFDTQVAAGFVDLLYPASLGKLVEALAGIELDPGAKFSQWDRRPLTPMQKHYAANDVRYLHLLRDAIGEKLEAADRVAWAKQEMGVFENPGLYQFDPQSQKLKGVAASRLTRRQRHILRRLIDWRGQAAIDQDVPTRILLPDACLGEMAKLPEASGKLLNQIKGIPKVVREAYGPQILCVIDDALTGKVPKEKNGPRFDEDEHGPTLQALWSAIGQTCQSQTVAQALAVNKNEVTQLVVNPTRPTRLKQGWRWDVFGGLLQEHLGIETP